MDNGYLVLKLEANGTDQRRELVHTRKAASNLGDHQLSPNGCVSVPIWTGHDTKRTPVGGFSTPHVYIWASWYS